MSEELDFSKAIQQVQQMLSSEEGESQIQNLINMLASGSEEKSPEESPESSPLSGLFGNGKMDLSKSMEDMETIMKIKNIMGAISGQKPNEKTVFLQALKPFLKKERREKIEQAAKILTITQALKAFKNNDTGGV